MIDFDISTLKFDANGLIPAIVVDAATKDVPIVGAAVTDFIIAGGVSSVSEPAGNVTGISDLPPMQSQRDYLLSVADGSRIGIVYCSNELGSGFQVKVLGFRPTYQHVGLM